MPAPTQPDGHVPSFLGRDTAALLTPASPGQAASAAQPGQAAAPAPDLDSLTRRLWQELLRRMDLGETRVYEKDLLAEGSISPASLREAFQALGRAGLVEWEGAYLYLRRPPDAAPAASQEAGEEELAEVYRAIQEATGKTFSEDGRLREWLSVLGLQDVLDEINLCRQRGTCRLNQVIFALNRANNRAKNTGPFGAMGGRGILPAAAGPPIQGEATAAAAVATANARAYDPVPPEMVKAWAAAHPELYADQSPGPPPAASGGRPAAWASAYDPVPAEMVRRWAEAFPAEYEEYRREYRRLAEQAQSGAFRRRQTRIR